MLHYSRLQLVTIVAVPIVTIVLIWAVVIFHKNRKKWRCFDLAIVAILVQSVLRNLSIVAYTALQMLDQDDIRFDYCSLFVWTFNSIHTFQASTLSTLAVIGLFSMKLYRKKESLKHYLTTAHVVYHLFCLTTLCACVGVAAILAKKTQSDFAVSFDLFPLNLCKFMPYEMDVKYNAFIITLHVFLAAISLVAFAFICYHFCVARRDGFGYLKKSNSDLSELSLGLGSGEGKGFYDTYGAPKMEEAEAHGQHFHGHREPHWNSDTSNISTTVSSTNSRRPCLNKKKSEQEADAIGLETILPILTVCYLFNHVPIIILCLFPRVLSPWSVASAALCLGLLQDVLVPLSLALVDTRFCQWVSEVYRCTDRKKLNEKLPQVGLDGKFRTFNSQPQSLEAGQVPPERPRTYQPSGEPKFPITNGSLYTSIDGRLPIIHNYRRHKDRGTKPTENNLINLGVHATYLKQQEQNTSAPKIPRVDYSCSMCEEKAEKQTVAVAKPGHVDAEVKLHSSLYNFPPPNFNRTILDLSSKRVSVSHSNLRCHEGGQHAKRPVAEGLRLSRSQDSLDKVEKDLNMFRRRIGSPDAADSEEEYFTDSMNLEADGTCGSSSQSEYSITTEANCDFDFYQMNEDLANNNCVGDFVTMHSHRTFDFYRSRNDVDCLPRVLQTFKPQALPRGNNVTIISTEELNEPVGRSGFRGGFHVNDLDRNFKIKRSNSKRSLENFRAFIKDNEFSNCSTMQRSCSYLDLDENRNVPKDCNYRKHVSSNCVNFLVADENGYQQTVFKCSESVPDFKKIFISDYL